MTPATVIEGLGEPPRIGRLRIASHSCCKHSPNPPMTVAGVTHPAPPPDKIHMSPSLVAGRPIKLLGSRTSHLKHCCEGDGGDNLKRMGSEAEGQLMVTDSNVRQRKDSDPDKKNKV